MLQGNGNILLVFLIMFSQVQFLIVVMLIIDGLNELCFSSCLKKLLHKKTLAFSRYINVGRIAFVNTLSTC